MNTRDINTIQTPYEKRHLSVLGAFFQGHILQIQGEEYRFAKKDGLLYEEDTPEGVVEYHATQSGLFKKMYSYSGTVKSYTPENADRFIYVLVAECMDGIMGLIASMSEEEIFAALSSRALTDFHQEQKPDRSKATLHA